MTELNTEKGEEMRRMSAVIMAIALVSVALPGLAAKGGGKPPAPDNGVTTTMKSGYSMVGSQFMDVDYANGNGVISVIGTDWQFDTTTTNRTISVNFDAPVGAEAHPLSGWLTTATYSVAQCRDYEGSGGLGFDTIRVADGPIHCGLAVNVWHAAGGSTNRYRISMFPYRKLGTEGVLVSCVGETNGACSSWTVTPDDVDGDAKARARLIWVSEKGKPQEIDLGDYLLDFRIELNR